MVFEEEEDRIKFTTANNQILEARKRAEKGLEAENDEKKDGGLNIAQLMTGSSPKVEEVKF